MSKRVKWAKDLINNRVNCRLNTGYYRLPLNIGYYKRLYKSKYKMVSCHLGSSLRTKIVCKNFFLRNPCVLKFNQSMLIFLVALPSHEICRFSEGKVFVKSLYVKHSKYTTIWYLKVSCKKTLYLWS